MVSDVCADYSIVPHHNALALLVHRLEFRQFAILLVVGIPTTEFTGHWLYIASLSLCASMHVRVCVCVCVRACVRACVCVCARARALAVPPLLKAVRIKYSHFGRCDALSDRLTNLETRPRNHLLGRAITLADVPQALYGLNTRDGPPLDTSFTRSFLDLRR